MFWVSVLSGMCGMIVISGLCGLGGLGILNVLGGLGFLGGLGDLGGFVCLGVPGGFCYLGAKMQIPGNAVFTIFLQQCSFYGFCMNFYCVFFYVFANICMFT